MYPVSSKAVQQRHVKIKHYRIRQALRGDSDRFSSVARLKNEQYARIAPELPGEVPDL